jgi:hypothetical protein
MYFNYVVGKCRKLEVSSGEGVCMVFVCVCVNKEGLFSQQMRFYGGLLKERALGTR